MLSRIVSSRPWLAVLTVTVLATAASAQDNESPIIAQGKAELKHPDRPFVLLVRVQLKDGMQKKFEAAFATSRQSTRKEKGNLAYQLTRNAKDSTHYVVYEHWKNLAALESHVQSQYVTTLLSEVHDMVEAAPEMEF